jgi:hypothetical protein
VAYDDEIDAGTYADRAVRADEITAKLERWQAARRLGLDTYEDLRELREQAYGPRPALDLTAAQRIRQRVVCTLAEHWEFDNVDELLAEVSTVAAWVEEGGEPGAGLPLPAELIATVEEYDRMIRHWGKLWTAVQEWVRTTPGDRDAGVTLANVVVEIDRELTNETGEQA